MFNKGQGKTMGSYYTLLNALIEDGRVEEAEELFQKIFSRYMEGLPRSFFMRMISLYYKLGSYDKMFEIQKIISGMLYFIFSLYKLSKKKLNRRGRTAPQLCLIEKLNLLRSRKTTNPGPILRESPPMVQALTHALGPPHT
jgi:pentatricopeptide repeat protein